MSTNLVSSNSIGKLAIKQIVAIGIADKHTWIVLNIALSNEHLKALKVYHNRTKRQLGSIQLVEWQIVVYILKRGEILILLCAREVVVCNPHIVRLTKIEGSHLVLNSKRSFASGCKAIGNTLVVCTELNSRTVRKLNLQCVVVVGNGATGVESGRYSLVMAIGSNLSYLTATKHSTIIKTHCCDRWRKDRLIVIRESVGSTITHRNLCHDLSIWRDQSIATLCRARAEQSTEKCYQE